MIGYGFVKELNLPFEQAVEMVTQELKKEGFGVLTTIDVQEKLKEKLGVDFKKYVILGACNPPSAHKAILAEENIGLMLPCNVLVYEKAEKTVLAVVRPTTAMQMIENVELQSIAEQIEVKLKKVFDAVTDSLAV